MDDVSWGVLALALTLLGGTYTWWAYQHRGVAPALRGAAITLLPLAAYLTKTLKMFTRIADAIAAWATSLVFSPAVWLGVVVAGMSVLLFGAARVVERRTGPREVDEPATSRRTLRKERALPAAPEPAASSGRKAEPAISTDDDTAEIEAILRKRGIS
ncbi:hypothetical protein BH11ACT8_BH11ACT8_24530 [soil metagenome]